MERKNLDRVLTRIGDDFRAVTPLRSPWRRAGFVAFWAVLSAAVALGLFGLRKDCTELGPWLSWVPSIAAVAGAYALLWLAGREAVPGAGVHPAIAVSFCMLAVVLHFVVGHYTYQCSPLVAEQTYGMCGAAILFIGVPVLLVGARIARSGLVLRPWLAGLLIGVAAGVSADAIWRLHCPYTNPYHFFLSHTLPYGVLVAFGLLALWRVGRARSSKSDAESDV